MSTETLDRVKENPDLQETDSSKDNEVFHYVRKSRIAQSAVMGDMVVALCGETFPVTKSAKPGSPVCKECKEIYNALPGGGK